VLGAGVVAVVREELDPLYAMLIREHFGTFTVEGLIAPNDDQPVGKLNVA
jgi:hypothetical protein